VKRHHLVLALIWLMMFVAYFDRINITVAGPAIASSLDLAPASFGFILAAFTFGYALMQIPGGYLADRFGSRPLLIFALVFWSIFTGLTGLATSFAMLVVIRIFFGIGEGLENGAQFKLIGDNFPPRERSAANAVFLTALSLGPAVAAPIAGWLVVHTGWQALFFWFTIPGLLVAALLALLLPRGETAMRGEGEHLASAPRPATASEGRWRAALGSATSWLAFGAYLCFNVAFWGFIGWMPTYLNATRHIALNHLGAIASVPYICGFAGTMLVGWLGTTLFARHRPALVAVAYLCAGASLYAAFSAQGVGQSIAGLSCAAFFLYGGFGPFWAIALDLIRSDMRGAFTGFVNLGGQIGGFFAPIVVGAIVGATKSFSGGFAFMIGALMLSAISLFWLEFAIGRASARGLPDEPRLRPA
jgi:sugar phosphate permease